MNAPDRLARLRSRMADLEVDAFLVSDPLNRLYLSGFTGSSGYLVVTQTDTVLVTDFRYVEQAAREASSYRVHRTRSGVPWLPEVAGRLRVRRLGFESDHVSVALHTRFISSLEESDDASGVGLQPTSGVIESIRGVKDAGELALVERAVQVADEGMASAASVVEPGITEAQIAWHIEQELRRLGAEGPAFDIIVAAGPNGALPHHRADDTVVKDGDAVVIDMGALHQNYRSDLTRTLAVGHPGEKFASIYASVLEAQQAAIDGARPGMAGKEIDSIARDVISEAGYGDEFGHGLGHGVGLAVHEHPMVVPKCEDVIENGMVFTVEPGIYISGWGGVRIEDMVVMENGRARVLTASPK